MFQEYLYKNKFVFFILLGFTRFLSSNSASITTLSSSTYHHFELTSNNSYRQFFLRQYFIDLINISHSSFVQSMINNHHLTPKLEQIQNRKRRDDLHQTTKCKLKTIQIKFEELGLADFIIRPKEYTFTYCDGSCLNIIFQPQSSIHTFLQSLISKKNSNIPQLNCVPSEYSDDNFLLRQTDGNMGIYSIKNAIVKQCACL